MYQSHFGLTRKPFEVTPDPRFLYMTPGHREALASILYGIRHRKGFVTLVGEAGTGKTTLLRAALGQLNGNTRTAFIFNANLPFLQVLALILHEFDLLGSLKKLNKLTALRRLNDFGIRQLAGGGNVVIMVDEAQNFDPRTIEGLRLLSNLESDRHRMIQVVLAGQPELDQKLKKPAMQPFVQRIHLRRCTTALTEKETYQYIRHRLKVAGGEGADIFSRKALKLVWRHSGGIPRKINTLSDNALLNAYAARKNKVKHTHVAEAVNDLTLGRYPN